MRITTETRTPASKDPGVRFRRHARRPSPSALPSSARVALGASVAASALLLASCGSTSTVELVSAEQAQDLVDSGVTVVDVRTPAEFAQGHIEGAVNVDVESGSFDTAIAAYPTDDEYLVYCRSGNRSQTATAEMADQGFEEVSELDGGVIAWTQAGYPLVY